LTPATLKVGQIQNPFKHQSFFTLILTSYQHEMPAKIQSSS
jgi:hypothetical protein